MNEIIKSLEDLVSVHVEILDISKEKTEVIKEGSVEKLQKLLVNERKLVRKVENNEKERKVLVDHWFENRKLSLEDATVTNMLELLDDEEDKNNLEQVTIALTKVITNLKAQEKLNLALISQSMQFVQVSLDLLSPSLKNMNYGNKPNEEEPTRSVFDSKA